MNNAALFREEIYKAIKFIEKEEIIKWNYLKKFIY
jgi:hypothetical protein